MLCNLKWNKFSLLEICVFIQTIQSYNFKLSKCSPPPLHSWQMLMFVTLKALALKYSPSKPNQEFSGDLLLFRQVVSRELLYGNSAYCTCHKTLYKPRRQFPFVPFPRILVSFYTSSCLLFLFFPTAAFWVKRELAKVAWIQVSWQVALLK